MVKAKKSYANWFEKLSPEQLSALCEAADLPRSGSRPKKVERLLSSDLTNRYALEATGADDSRAYALAIRGDEDAWRNDFGQGDSGRYGAAKALRKIPCSFLKSECDAAGLKTAGGRYDLVLRLARHASGKAAPAKRARDADGDSDDDDASGGGGRAAAPKRAKAELSGDALAKRAKFRQNKLSAAMGARLKWTSSMRSMKAPKGGRSAIDCEPEVFRALFASGTIKTSGDKMSTSFADEDACLRAGVSGKSYRYGACARIKSASASHAHGKLTLSFKYLVE